MTNTVKLQILWALAFLAFLGLTSITSAQAQNLNGNWDLRPHPQPATTIPVTIEHSGSTITIIGHNWQGRGSFAGGEGVFDWSDSAGRSGTGSFTYNPVYDRLDGGSFGGSSTPFVGNRAGSVAAVAGTWLCGGSTTFIVRQIGSSVLGALTRTTPGRGEIRGAISGNRISVWIDRPGAPPSASDLYLSVDGSTLSGFIWWKPSGFEAPTCTLVDMAGTPTPPNGWITPMRNQYCLTNGAYQGGVLSCGSDTGQGESGLCHDPRANTLIDTWLANSKPSTGSGYDCWGRLLQVGGGYGAVSDHNCHKPDTGGLTRCEFLLRQASAAVASGNHNGQTLEQYVRDQITK